MNEKIKKLSSLGRVARKHASMLDEYDCDLSGACGIASFQLFRLARYYKLYPTFVEGSIHCWLEYYGYIVDVTATQWGRFPIIFVLRTRLRTSFMWYNCVNLRSCNTSEIKHSLLRWNGGEIFSRLDTLYKRHATTIDSIARQNFSD